MGAFVSKGILCCVNVAQASAFIWGYRQVCATQDLGVNKFRDLDIMVITLSGCEVLYISRAFRVRVI
jgi:hypothetical protein